MLGVISSMPFDEIATGSGLGGVEVRRKAVNPVALSASPKTVEQKTVAESPTYPAVETGQTPQATPPAKKYQNEIFLQL